MTELAQNLLGLGGLVFLFFAGIGVMALLGNSSIELEYKKTPKKEPND